MHRGRPAVFDRLDGPTEVPSDWQLKLRTYVKAASGGRPRLHACRHPRTVRPLSRYLVTDSPVSTGCHEQQDVLVTTAGFAIDRELFASCNAPEEFVRLCCNRQTRGAD